MAKLNDGKKESTSRTFDGNVVSCSDNTLVMKNKEGKEYSHTLAQDAKLTCDGNICKPEDLKTGNQVRVTTQKQDQANKAIKIEALDQNAEFPK